MSCFDKINENDNDKNSLKQILLTNHEQANREKIKGQLPPKYLFGFCKTFEKITKNLGFHVTFETRDLQDMIYTLLADAFLITSNNLYLYVPVFIPSPETQAMFNQSIKSKYSFSYDSWTTDRKIVNDGLQFQGRYRECSKY